jgi:cellulose biosynthesis protein BcsQ
MLSKGGEGKTVIALLISWFFTLMNKNVVIIDQDALPGITNWLSGFQVTKPQQELIARVRRQPALYAIDRLYLRPEMGLTDFMTYDVWEGIIRLNKVPRLKASRINDATIIDRTIAAYGIDEHRIGKMYLVPNAGTLDGITNQLVENKLRSPSYDVDGALARALPIVAEAHLQKTGERIDAFVIDCPGARDLPARLGATAASNVILPFGAQKPALAGLLNSVEDIRQIQDDLGTGFPRIHDPILNRYRDVPPDPEEPTMESWLSNVARPQLAGANLRLNDIRVPYHRDMERASEQGILPMEYSPLCATMQGCYQLAKQLAQAVFHD